MRTKKADLKVGPLRSPNDAGYVQHLSKTGIKPFGDSPENCVPAAWTGFRLAAFFYGAGVSCAAVSAFGGGVGDIPLSRNFCARLPGATSAT
jgi:hypothetical protein